MWQLAQRPFTALERTLRRLHTSREDLAAVDLAWPGLPVGGSGGYVMATSHSHPVTPRNGPALNASRRVVSKAGPATSHSLNPSLWRTVARACSPRSFT